jgi:hypothetical protein
VEFVTGWMTFSSLRSGKIMIQRVKGDRLWVNDIEKRRHADALVNPGLPPRKLYDNLRSSATSMVPRGLMATLM